VTTSNLKSSILLAKKNAMRNKDKSTLGTLRLILADIKRVEVDERIEADDNRILTILDKMLKQRRDSINQYLSADREDLANIEKIEVEVINKFLPEPLNESEIKELILDAIKKSNASSIKDMGKVMGILKPKLQGRADIGSVSKKIKEFF
jgi:uncharacterized protein YqeY